MKDDGGFGYMIGVKTLFPDKEYFIKCVKAGGDIPLPRHEPGYRLYGDILRWHEEKPSELFSKEFAELVYATLDSWRMNVRRAKLCEFNFFYQQMQESRTTLLKLNDIRIEDASDNDISSAATLFERLKLTKTDSKIVTTSKTLHFYLPNFIPPIDRENTLSELFYPNYSPSDEKKCFESILAEYKLVCESLGLSKRVIIDNFKNSPSIPIPKIIDFAIIGRRLLRK
jgi:hypothetical protein